VARQDVDWPNLSYVSLNSNAMTEVPSILKFLPKLKQLHLHMNKLTQVRELCRREFENLDVLDLGNNKITEVPVALAHYCKSLGTLNLINNDLAALPSLLGLHANLKNLQIEGNPVK